MKRSVYWVFAAFACFWAMGCGDSTNNMGIDGMEITATHCQDDEDNDSDELTDCDDPDCQGYVFCVDTGGDSDTDTDTDTDSDTDTDTDTDTHSDTDTDIDTDTDTDTDEDPLDCEGGRYDESAGLCWQHPRAYGDFEWQEAIDYCYTLDLAGHTDWVLPTRQDFIDLLGDCDEFVLSGGWGWCDSCLMSDTCDALFGFDTERYWSSTIYEDSGVYSYFLDGGFYGGLGRHVRCVRPGP